MIVVLALKTNRIGQSFLPRPFRALFSDFSPRFVLRAPGDLASVVGQFLWRAQVVTLVLGQYINRVRLDFVGPQRIFIDVITTFVTRLGQEAHRLVTQGLGHGDEAAGFVEVVNGFATGAIGLRGAAFPGEGIAVPAVVGEAATPRKGLLDSAIYKLLSQVRRDFVHIYSQGSKSRF